MLKKQLRAILEFMSIFHNEAAFLGWYFFRYMGEGQGNGTKKAYSYIQCAYDKFPDVFRMGTFIDSTHIKL